METCDGSLDVPKAIFPRISIWRILRSYPVSNEYLRYLPERSSVERSFRCGRLEVMRLDGFVAFWLIRESHRVPRRCYTQHIFAFIVLTRLSRMVVVFPLGSFIGLAATQRRPVAWCFVFRTIVLEHIPETRILIKCWLSWNMAIRNVSKDAGQNT